MVVTEYIIAQETAAVYDDGCVYRATVEALLNIGSDDKGEEEEEEEDFIIRHRARSVSSSPGRDIPYWMRNEAEAEAQEQEEDTGLLVRMLQEISSVGLLQILMNHTAVKEKVSVFRMFVMSVLVSHSMYIG